MQYPQDHADHEAPLDHRRGPRRPPPSLPQVGRRQSRRSEPITPTGAQRNVWSARAAADAAHPSDEKEVMKRRG